MDDGLVERIVRQAGAPDLVNVLAEQDPHLLVRHDANGLAAVERLLD